MTTFTQSLLRSSPPDVHVGLNVVASITPGGETSATGTAASVFLLVRVPNGATIVDWHLHITTGSTTNQTVQIGTSASPSGIAALFSLSTSFSASISLDVVAAEIADHRAPKGDRLPVRISLSDDVQPAEVWIQLAVTADICATAFMSFTLFYVMDGLTGRRTIR